MLKYLPTGTTLETLIGEWRSVVDAITGLERTRLRGRNVTDMRDEPSGSGTSNDVVGDMYYGATHLFVFVQDDAGARKWKKINWTDA